MDIFHVNLDHIYMDQKEQIINHILIKYNILIIIKERISMKIADIYNNREMNTFLKRACLLDLKDDIIIKHL